MGKDPAILWYFGDWGGGTSTFNRFQKGCYMDLLNAQYHSGPLSLEEIKTVLGNDFAAWGVLSKKFKQTESGLFFNERLETEKNKRRAFVTSRKKNLSGGDAHMDPHMENGNEDVNKNKTKGIVKGRFVKPTLDEVRAYCLERANGIRPEKFLSYYESNGWKVGKNPMKNWRAAIRTWEQNNTKSKNSGIDRLKSLVISGGGDEQN